jgi:hypothetical protein
MVKGAFLAALKKIPKMQKCIPSSRFAKLCSLPFAISSAHDDADLGDYLPGFESPSMPVLVG